MKKSGIVLKIRNIEAVVINDHGEYQRIKSVKGMFEGQFVEYGEDALLEETGGFKYMMVAASAAAVLIIVAVLLFGSSSNNIYAFIDLDTNPSMEFTIDNKNHVVDLKVFDKKTVFPVKSNDVKGMNINHAVVYVVSNLRKSGNIKPDDNNLILISAINVNEQSQQKDQKLTGIVESLKSEIIKSTGQELKVESIIPLADIRKSSVENNISMGRYTLYSNALKSGADITIDTAKKGDINDLIKYKNLNSKPENTQNEDNSSINVNKGMTSGIGNNKTGIHTGPGKNERILSPNNYPGYNEQSVKNPIDNNFPRRDLNINPDKPIHTANIPDPDEHDKENKGIMPVNPPPVGGSISGGKGLPDIAPPPQAGNKGMMPGNLPPVGGSISGGKGLPDITPPPHGGNKGMAPGDAQHIEPPPIGGKQLPPNIDPQKQSGGLNANGGAPYSGSQPAAGSHSGLNGLPAPNMNPSMPKDHPPQVQPPKPLGQKNEGRTPPEAPRFGPPNKDAPHRR